MQPTAILMLIKPCLAATGGDLPSYYSHLKKRTYDPEEREARKKQRNDLKEAARLAQLSKPGSS